MFVNMQGGQERGFQRLDDVWTRYEDPAGCCVAEVRGARSRW